MRDGKFEFVVSSVKCGVPTVGPTVGPGIDSVTAQGQFCIATMTVRNIGSEAQTFDSDWQYAYNVAGTKFDVNGSASLAAHSGTQSFLQQINPGNQITVKVVYDVPRGTTITRLELHDSILSGGVDVTVGQ